MALTRRQQVLGGLLVGTAALAVAMLAQVIETVFFAITVAYMLYPVRRELSERGAPRQAAAAMAAAVGFLFVLVAFTPIVVALYVRRGELLAFIRDVPSELTVEVLGFEYPVDVSQLLLQARDAVIDVGVTTASAAPVLALKAFLFAILLYGLLLRPGSVRRAVVRVAPDEYHDVVFALHRRVRDTLYALYVLQAATAVGTFVVAYGVFWALGYDAAFLFAVLSGILQFVPILGPSLLVLLVAAGQLLAGEVAAAVLVTVFGFVLVGFLPDAVIRPRLASVTTGMPASLYFVGFTGGTLTIGVAGVIAGPLVVAVLVEVVDLVARERATGQSTLTDARAGADDGTDGASDDPDDTNSEPEADHGDSEGDDGPPTDSAADPFDG
jgi:predicted PurR-regulated permease PerM